MTPQAPVCLAMLLCQDVLLEETRNLISIIGIFEDLYSPRFPVRMTRLFVYAELSGGRGHVPVLMRLFRRTPDDVDGEEITRFGSNLLFPGPDHLERLIVEVPNLELPLPGEYRVIRTRTASTFPSGD